jgi:hypothetical protein
LEKCSPINTRPYTSFKPFKSISHEPYVVVKRKYEYLDDHLLFGKLKGDAVGPPSRR